MSLSDITIKAEAFDLDRIDGSTSMLNAYVISSASAGQGVKWHDPNVTLFLKLF